MSKYLIKLKPLSQYFFGGEDTFGSDKRNYLIKSNYLPQQTTLLGFIRYELLLQNNLLGTEPDRNWADLIGDKSFQKELSGFTSDFGAIKSLSPLFLSNGEDNYLPQANDWAMMKQKEVDEKTGLPLEKVHPIRVTFDDQANVIYENKLSFVPQLNVNGFAFDPKLKLKPLWVDSSGEKLRQFEFEKDFKEGRGFENGFFIEKSQIGINKKTKRTKDDDGDFYKQVFYQLADDYCFSFIVDIELPVNKKLANRVVTMGGERSMFYMDVSPTAKSFEDIFTTNTFKHIVSKDYDVLILTSDTYSEVEVNSLCDFAITDTVPFRNIVTVKNTANDYIKIRGGNLNKTTELNFLLKRGSVFYGSDLGELVKAITNAAFNNIGYNNFIIIKRK